MSDTVMWWGAGEMAEGETRFWRIGPLDVWVRLSGDEWFVTTRGGSDPFDQQVVCTGCLEPPPADAVWTRTVGVEGGTFRWHPKLADRPVVVRPDSPLRLLPNASSTFYVGTQLWACLEAGTGSQSVLEIPISRPSDTWFGPSTREGELCYAGRTTARRTVAELPRRATRAATPMTVTNGGPDTLLLERVKVPVPNLALYQAANGRLWSSEIRVRRDSADNVVDVTVIDGPPAAAGESTAVGEPRLAMGGAFRRALSGLIG